MARSRSPWRRSLAAGAALVTGVLAIGAAALVAAPVAQAASLTQVTNFGSNPGGLQMYTYVPDKLAANPGIVVAVHYCTGSASAYYNGTQFDELANTYGYIVIYPSASRPGACFDVSSTQALSHTGQSDPASIVQMVRYVQQRYTTDTSKVFITGLSSGAMTTELLLADYPDVFAAGSAWAGVPATCFSTGGSAPGANNQAGWNSDCANGTLNKTAQQWGDLARGVYPGYSGSRPRVQLWHGTNDTTLSYNNFGEAVEQWTNVLGVSATPSSTVVSGSTTRTRYGSNTGDQAVLEANSLQGASHSLTVDARAVIHFFGLDSTTPTPTPTPTTPTPTPTPTTPTPTPTTPTPTPTTPTPTPTSGPAGCSVAYGVNQWNTGFTANVTIKNTSASALNGWTLKFTFPSGQTITQAWSSKATQSGSAVTITNESWNGSLAPGASTQLGFNASHTGTNTAPSSFTLNGTTCAAG